MAQLTSSPLAPNDLAVVDCLSNQPGSSSMQMDLPPSWSFSPNRSFSPSTIRDEDLRLLDPTYCPMHFSQTPSAQVHVDSSGELHDPDFWYFPPLGRGLSPIEEEKEDPTSDDEYAWYMAHPHRRVSRPGRMTPRSSNSVIGLGLGLDSTSGDANPGSRPISVATSSSHSRTDSGDSINHPRSSAHYYSSDMSTSCTSLESAETALTESSVGLGTDYGVVGIQEAWMSSNSSTALSGQEAAGPIGDDETEDVMRTVKIKSIHRFLPRSQSHHDRADSAASSVSSLDSTTSSGNVATSQRHRTPPPPSMSTSSSKSKRSSMWHTAKDTVNQNTSRIKRNRPFSFLSFFSAPLPH